MKLYDNKNIADFYAEDTKSKYLKSLVDNGLEFYINNCCNAKIAILEYENIYLPLIISEKCKNQTYLTSLVSSYVDYPKQILKSRFFDILFNIFEKFLYFASVDKVIYVNHWMISTNIQSDLSSEQVKEITKFLKQNFPDYAICFRNIAKELNLKIFQALKINKYKFLVYRKSYLTKKNEFDFVFGTKNIKKDIALCKKKKYKLSEIQSDASFQAILYKYLYINKYTPLNPQYNENFFKMLTDTGFKGYKLVNETGDIVGFFVPYQDMEMLVVPWLGYNTNLPQKEGLYRNLCLNIVNYTNNRNEDLIWSSGVGEFKESRGAVPYWEYIAVDCSHLNIFRKIVFFALIFITNKISFPLTKLFNIKFF